MIKHKGFPSRMPSSDYQFTIRRANKKGATKLIARERYSDRKNIDKMADSYFFEALLNYFGEEPFVRGNLDAGRLSWLLGREVIAVETEFNPEDYEALLKINKERAMVSFPEVFE